LLRTRPRVAHARIFFVKTALARKKKVFSKELERERDRFWSSGVPVSSKDSLSFKLGGVGTKIKNMAGCVEFIASLSFLFVRFCSDRERSSDPREEKVQKTKSAVFEIAFFFLFAPREIGPRKIQKPLQKGGSGTNF
jgi:hypothetical protein